MNKKFWLIIGIVALIILVIIIWWLVSKRVSPPKSPPSPTVQPSPVLPERPQPITPSPLYTFNFSRSDEKLSEEGIETAIDIPTNQIISRTKEGGFTRLKLANYPAPFPGLIFSPNQKLAVGRFPVPTEIDVTLFLLTENQEPQQLNETIENVALVLDNGELIYHAEDAKDNIISRGTFNRGSERALTNVDDMYLGFAVLDENTLLYWGAPTAPGGNNLYQLNLNSGARIPLIEDSTVVDAAFSPLHKLLLVLRYLNDKNSLWLYSLEKKQFLRDFKIDFDLNSFAWKEDETAVAFWDLEKPEIKIISLESGKIETAGSFFSLAETFPKPLIGWKNQTITIYSETKKQ